MEVLMVQMVQELILGLDRAVQPVNLENLMVLYMAEVAGEASMELALTEPEVEFIQVVGIFFGTSAKPNTGGGGGGGTHGGANGGSGIVIVRGYKYE